MPVGKDGINEKSGWREMTEGLQMYEPGTSKSFMTGEWRTSTPVWDREKCKQCLLCIPYCPDSCIRAVDNKRQEFDYDHCKGCGICAKVCPFKAIVMEE